MMFEWITLDLARKGLSMDNKMKHMYPNYRGVPDSKLGAHARLGAHALYIEKNNYEIDKEESLLLRMESQQVNQCNQAST